MDGGIAIRSSRHAMGGDWEKGNTIEQQGLALWSMVKNTI